MRSLQELYADNNLPASNRTRSAELSPTTLNGMYLTRNDVFTFLRNGRPLYNMPYNEAEILHKFAVIANDKVLAIRTMRAFRPNLSLVDVKDMVEYIVKSFINIG